MDRQRSQELVDLAAPTRAVIYARVSTDDQIKGTSLHGQVERCRTAAATGGWNVVGEFVDEGVSGALSRRPRLDALVRLVEDHQVDVVAITKLDRIARSLRHLLDLLDLFERHHVRLVALDDPLDPSTASGRAMVHLRGVFAELERQLIRERTMEGLRRRVEAGGWPGGPPPYGYQVVDNPEGGGRRLEVQPDEAAVIRLAYGLIVEEGYTTGETADELNRLGSRPRRSPEWTHRRLRALLVDAHGLSGRWLWRRAGRNGRRRTDEIELEIPAILDGYEHELLRMSLAATATQPSVRQNYLLSGRIWSPHGARMQGISSPDGARWYRCPHRPTHRSPGTDRCECGRLHGATIEHAVWEQVTSLVGNPAALEALAADRDSERRNHAERERASLSQLDARIAATEAEIANEYSALRDEGFDPAAARAAIRRRNDRLVSLRKERADLLRLRGKNLAAAGLATRLRALAAQARVALEEADATVRRKVIDLLVIQVHIVQWEPCDTCAGKGLLPASGPRRRNVGAAGYLPRKPTLCPDCLRTRQIPVVRVSGNVPELLVAALAEAAEMAEITPDIGPVFAFQAVVRVA